MKKRVLTIFASIAILVLNGCDSSTYSDSSLGGDSSSTDKLTLTQSGNNFTIDWRKRTSSYSKVTYNGSKIIAHNFTGLYTLNCKPSNSDENSVDYSCKGEGPSILGGKDTFTANLFFKKNDQYKFRVTYGTFSSARDGEIVAILQYSGNTLSIH